MSLRKSPLGNKTYWVPGEIAWFEYHCCPSAESADAELWYHSKERVEVVGIVERGYGRTMMDRLESNVPRMYKIRFKDGFEGAAFEDELLTSRKWFDEAYTRGER